jgi:hypothetical protein
MKKKLLVFAVSILAVVLLVLGSLSNVVGYQSVKSTTVSDSPLFQTRTQKATNQQQNSITSQYLGMRRENPLQFPIKDNRTEQLKKVIDIISKMDDKTYTRFTELCIQKTRQDNALRDISYYQIIQALLLLKTNPEEVKYFFANRNNQGDTIFPTYCGTGTFCGGWPPGCLIIGIIYLIICSPIIILLIILDSLTISGSYYCENPS